MDGDDRGTLVPRIPCPIKEYSSAACSAAQAVIEGGRIPDDATVDVLARRMAAGAPAAEGGADLSVYDGFLKGGEAHAC